MKEFRYVITDPDGIHARPAGEFVKAAKEFEADIKITVNGKCADAKKIFAVMGLAAKQGHEAVICIDGPDEEQAATEIEKFMRNNL